MSVVSTLPGNIERYYAARLIGMMANTRLVAALPATGWYPEVKVDNEYLPVEITRLNIVLRPSDPAGLPAGVELVPGEQVVTIAREVVDALFASEPTAAELKKLKAALVKNIEMWRTTPVGVETSTRYRFSYGKDMFSKNKETIEAITPADIKEMLKSFGEGCKAEYRVMQ